MPRVKHRQRRMCHTCDGLYSQLLNLLQNKSIMTQENLLIDIQNPLEKYRSPNGVLADAISGSVYQTAYDRLIQNPERELFVPIIQWIDRTNVSGNDRFTLTISQTIVNCIAIISKLCSSIEEHSSSNRISRSYTC